MNSRNVFETSLVDHIPYIKRVVSKIAKNSDVVDDISQEVCVRIIEKEKFWNKNTNQLSAWMNAIARNFTLNYVRQKKEQLLDGKEDYFLCPEVEKFSEEQIEWVVTQFQILSQKQQQILKMKYYQNMKITEIAKLLGMARPNVSREIKTALNTLRKRAKAQGLLAALLPWHWDRALSMKVVVMNKVKLGVTLFCLALIGFIGYEIFGKSFVSVGGNDKLSVDVPVSVITPVDSGSRIMGKNKFYSKNKLEVPEITIPDAAVIEADLEADLEATLKWLKVLHEEMPRLRTYEKMTDAQKSRGGDWTIEGLKNIKKLDLSLLAIENEDLKYLRCLTSLTELNLRGLHLINNTGLKHLTSLISLTSLDLSGTRIDGKGLVHLSPLTSLTSLRLFDTNIADEGLSHLKTLTALKHLDLSSTKVSDEGCKTLKMLTSLTKLDLWALTNITDEGVKHLSSLTSLNSLDLYCTKISDKGVKYLSTLPSLTYLNLTNTKLTEQGIKSLSGLPSLTKLVLMDVELTDQGIKNLSDLLFLTELTLSEKNITEQRIKNLSVLPSLTRLDLSNTKVSGQIVKNLSALTSLTRLDLVDAKFTDLGGAKNISSLTLLTELDLRGANITEEVFQTLKEALPNCEIKH